jgi:short-subunit dehydrogenase
MNARQILITGATNGIGLDEALAARNGIPRPDEPPAT